MQLWATRVSIGLNDGRKVTGEEKMGGVEKMRD